MNNHSSKYTKILKESLKFNIKKEKKQDTSFKTTYFQNIETLHREMLINEVYRVCNETNVDNSTKQKTIYLIDYCFGNFKIYPSDYLLLAYTCLMICTKVSNQQCTIIDIPVIKHLTDDKYTTEQIIDMELSVLQSIDWNVRIITPDIYSLYFELHVFKTRTLSYREQVQKLNYIIDLCFLDRKIAKFRPSSIYLGSLFFLLFQANHEHSFQSLKKKVQCLSDFNFQEITIIYEYLKKDIMEFESKNSVAEEEKEEKNYKVEKQQKIQDYVPPKQEIQIPITCSPISETKNKKKSPYDLGIDDYMYYEYNQCQKLDQRKLQQRSASQKRLSTSSSMNLSTLDSSGYSDQETQKIFSQSCDKEIDNNNQKKQGSQHIIDLFFDNE